MTKPDPQAAGQGGHEPIGATETQAKSGAPPGGAPPGEPPAFAPNGVAVGDNKLVTDEDFRRFAAAMLAGGLDYGNSLIGRAERLAAEHEGDRINPLFAAARLMNANARLAKEVGRLVQVEQRTRRIIEYVQPPVANSVDSNSTFEDSLERELRLKMLRYMKLVADETFDGVLKEAGAPYDDAPDAP